MIFTSFERMVAVRYLRARRQEGSLSVMAIFAMIGIALGVATLIVVMAVMNGFRADLLSRILGINGHLTVFADQGPIRDFDEFTERLRAVEGVSSVVPQVQGQVMVTSGGRALGGLVRGVRRETLEQRALIAQNIVAGSLSGFEGDDVVLLGSRLARRLGLSVGDDVTKGQRLGLSGATGLAGGDHLHFAILVGPTYVDPLEWWDPKWVREHVEVRLEQ